jgi:hypothetical protein
MAGLTGAVVFKLIDVMQNTLKQSKILSTFTETISKALGLLIDLVLLPFLPLLVWALIQLYQAIIAFGKNNPFKPGSLGGMEGLAGGILVGLAAALLGASAGWAIIAGIITAGIIAFLVPKAAELGAWVAGIVVGWGRDFGSMVVDAGKAVGTAISGVWAAWDKFWYDLGLAWIEFRKGLEAFWDTLKGFFSFKWVGEYLDGVKKQWSILLDAVDQVGKAFSLVWDTLVSGFKTFVNGLIWILNSLFDFVRNIPIIGGMVPANIPYLDKGGSIAKTGVAVVHAGETVVPAGKSGTTYNLNFYGLTNDQLPNKIREVLRQDGSRTY